MGFHIVTEDLSHTEGDDRLGESPVKIVSTSCTTRTMIHWQNGLAIIRRSLLMRWGFVSECEGEASSHSRGVNPQDRLNRCHGRQQE